MSQNNAKTNANSDSETNNKKYLITTLLYS